MESDRLMGTGFSLGMMKMLWNWIQAMAFTLYSYMSEIKATDPSCLFFFICEMRMEPHMRLLSAEQKRMYIILSTVTGTTTNSIKFKNIYQAPIKGQALF